MSHFYGSLHGSRGKATRCGTKSSGYEAIAASWQGAVETRLWHDEDTGLDMARVSLIPWHGAGVSKVLYEGPVRGESKAKES